jgi:hypothetical protein
MHQLLGGSINHLSAIRPPPDQPTVLPQLIAKPFEQGLTEAFDFAIFACLTAAAASWFRGGKYVHGGEHVRPVVESGDGELAMAASDGD